MPKRVRLAEAAEALGVTRAWVHQLCQQGRIPGARRVEHELGPYWTVPVGADGKPAIKPGKTKNGRPKK